MLKRAPANHEELLFSRYWPALHPGTPVKTPEGVALEEPLYAFVNDGRWIVQCPCGGAQLATPGVERAFCVYCLNEWCDGQWARVVWPSDVDGIEAALGERRHGRNKHWTPGETVHQLRAENEAGGPVTVPHASKHAIAPGTEVHPDSEMAKKKRAKS